jgi:2TM domain
MDEYDDFAAGSTERERAIRRRVHRLAEFYRHLFIYGVVIGSLWVYACWPLLTGGSVRNKWEWLWVIFPTAGWGIGIFFHGISVLPVWGFFSQDWEDRKVKQLLARDAERDQS